MLKNSQHSLYTIVGTIVVVVISVVISLVLTYNYISMKTKLTNNFENHSTKVINRLSITIKPFINTYSIQEYQKLIEIEIDNKEIYAIVIDDFLMGEVLSQKLYRSGKIRDKNSKIIDYKENLISNKEYSLLKTSKILKNNLVIGDLKIYYTNKYLNKELNELVKRYIYLLIVVIFTLIILIFLALKRYTIKPIKEIKDILIKQKKDDLPDIIQVYTISYEIALLIDTMNDMIKKIKASQKEIKKLNERYNLTLDAVDDGIWDWNLKTNKSYLSKKWKSMLGYSEEEIENSVKSFLNLIHKDDKKKAKKAIKKHFQDPINNKYDLEIRMLCKDGSYKWILSRGKVFLDKNNKPIRMLGTHSDITEKKEQEKVLAEQSKLASMGEMIGNIAHQWRQPLSVISTGATGLQLQHQFGLLTDELIEETCKTIDNNAQYLSKTIDDFKNYIKGDSKPIRFDLKNDTNSFLKLINSTIKKDNIKVILELEEHLEVKGYPNELIQCFINIFNNAKDALVENNIKQDERYIFITQYFKDNRIYIEFKDNAGGIPNDVINRIFEPYFTTKHKSQGTGLGLHMTYNLIKRGMKGDIEVKNETYQFNNKEYKGASFLISLPLDIEDKGER